MRSSGDTDWGTSDALVIIPLWLKWKGRASSLHPYSHLLRHSCCGTPPTPAPLGIPS